MSAAIGHLHGRENELGAL